jgi:tRNA pseudouridine32 synthase/23S rRNA pseudouridine746 synthase
MRLFPIDIDGSIPFKFNDPFRYSPHPLVRKAADIIISEIRSSEELSEAFDEGKMLGVLVVSDKGGRLGYLAGFSGNAGGRSRIEGYVPPIFDLLDPSGHFKTREAEISALNSEIKAASDSPEIRNLRHLLTEAEKSRDEETALMKESIARSKENREKVRQETSDPSRLDELIRESQHERAELKRLKIRWEKDIASIKEKISEHEGCIRKMRARRAEMSDELQKWIFSRYIVHNALGEVKSIMKIFEDEGDIPPGGTGECAAPKLLEYAFVNGLRPLAMGEFWYGLSPASAVRTQGHFYPSCTSKCGPLLRFMLKGTELETDPYPVCGKPEIIYDDSVLTVVSKPAGMPSVPGLDGKESLEDWLSHNFGTHITPVHRLDMDTSGIMVYAKDQESASALQRQFESHTISKTYKARLSKADEGMRLNAGDSGEICIPLNPDYDERPRQKADRNQGKHSVTEYRVENIRPDGSIDITFYPITGRTHQLRVHSAHILGLGHPIAGDLLYGGSVESRMHLHAFSISFGHPSTGERMSFETQANIY